MHESLRWKALFCFQNFVTNIGLFPINRKEILRWILRSQADLSHRISQEFFTLNYHLEILQ